MSGVSVGGEISPLLPTTLCIRLARGTLYGERMPKNHFDLLAKEIGQKALDSSGTTLVNKQINPEIQDVTLIGVAVFVAARGGGDCAAGGSRSPAGGAVIVLAALLGL